MCSDVAPCSKKDGLIANNAACQCGSTRCSTDSGSYCTKSTSTCGFGPACDSLTCPENSTPIGTAANCAAYPCTDADHRVCCTPNPGFWIAADGDVAAHTVFAACTKKVGPGDTGEYRKVDGTATADAACSACTTSTCTTCGNDLMITEIADPNNNREARFVELFNPSNVAIDLNNHFLRRWSGANTQAQSVSFALSGSISANGFYVVCNNKVKFKSVYNISADFEDSTFEDLDTNGPANSNGDDNIALISPDGNIIDMFGVIGEDGTGTGHEFEDGRAVRKCNTMASATWNESDWSVDNDSQDTGYGAGIQNAPGLFDPFSWSCGIGTWGAADGSTNCEVHEPQCGNRICSLDELKMAYNKRGACK